MNRLIRKFTYIAFLLPLTFFCLLLWCATVYGIFQGAFICIPLCIVVSYVWAILKNNLDAWLEMGHYEHHYGYLQEPEQ
jgi:hypothetical protein